jgi:hypothetical protein
MSWTVSEVEDPQENKTYFCAIKRSHTWWIIALGGILLEVVAIYLILDSNHSHTLKLIVIGLFSILLGLIIGLLVKWAYADVDVDANKYSAKSDCEQRCKELNHG